MKCFPAKFEFKVLTGKGIGIIQVTHSSILDEDTKSCIWFRQGAGSQALLLSFIFVENNITMLLHASSIFAFGS